MPPRKAFADSIEDIAAKANAAALKDREAAKEKALAPEAEASTEEKLKPILIAVGGGTLLSVPFFAQNLQRLFTKVSSGGEDAGYGSVRKGGKKPVKRGRGAKS